MDINNLRVLFARKVIANNQSTYMPKVSERRPSWKYNLRRTQKRYRRHRTETQGIPIFSTLPHLPALLSKGVTLGLRQQGSDNAVMLTFLWKIGMSQEDTGQWS